MTPIRAALALAIVVATSTVDAHAQPAGGFLRRHAIEIDLGGVWLGGVDFGSADATLTRNQAPRTPYTLFSTSSTLKPAAGAEGRVGFHLTSSLAVEGAFVFSRPSLETLVSGDVEGAPDTTARETLSQFLFDVSGVWHLRRVHIGRAVPFVLGGAGYLRELHVDNVLAQSGHTYHVGAGLKLPVLLRRGFIRSLGLRLDGRLYFRSGGADLDKEQPTRTTGAAGASLVVEL